MLYGFSFPAVSAPLEKLCLGSTRSKVMFYSQVLARREREKRGMKNFIKPCDVKVGLM